MVKIKKGLIAFLLLVCACIFLFACNDRKDSEGNKIAYSDIKSVKIDATSVADGFMLSTFDITEVYLLVTYSEESETGKAMKEKQDEEAEKSGTRIEAYNYTVRMNATEDMIKAEDKKKLKSAGSKTITLIYGKFEISFVLTLIDDLKSALHKVFFYDEDGTTLLTEMQYVADGERAIVPAVNTKDGFDFIGWKNKKTGNIETYDNITEDKEFVAVFLASLKEISFYVKYRSFDENDNVIKEAPATPIVIATVTIAREESVDAYFPEPIELEGYTFGAWETETDDDGNVQYYAIYDKNAYNVTFIYRPFIEDATLSHYSDSLLTKKVGYYADAASIEEPENAYCDGISPANDYQFIGWYVMHEGKKVNVEFPYHMSSVSEMCFYGNYVDINAGSDGLRYKKTGEDTCAISAYLSDDSILVIPSKVMIDGALCTVTGIDDGVFKNANVKEYVVSADNEYFAVDGGVLYSKRGDVLYAYPSASPQATFSIRAGTEEINPYAFFRSQNLTRINMPDSLLQIDDYAFSECTSLASIIVSQNVAIIEEGAFRMSSDCAATALTFAGTKLLEIGDEAFFGWNRLTELNLPASLRSVGDGAFYGYSSLRKVTADNNTYFSIYNGALYSSDYKNVILYPAQYVAENPEHYLHVDCRTVKRGAFYDAQIVCITISSACSLEAYSIVCPSMESLRFATDSFVLIEEQFEQAFGGFMPSVLYVLEGDTSFSVYSERVKPYSLNDWQGYNDFTENGFIYSESDTTITILGYKGSSTDIFIPNMYNEKRIVAVAPYAFYGNKYITSVTFPLTVRSIGEYAFYCCTSLETVSLSYVSGSDLSDIGDYAFYGCTALKYVTFEDSLQLSDFGKFVFDETPFLENSTDFLIVGGVLIRYSGRDSNVKVPQKVSYIATDAFKDVGYMTSIEFPSNSILRYVDEYAFQNCIGLKEIVFPATVRFVSDFAFYGCKYLFSVEYGSPRSAVEIEYFAYKEAGTYYTDFSPVYETFSDSTSYTLTFQVTVSEVYYDYGNAFVSPYELQETNDIFLGWYSNQFYTQKVVFPIHIESDTTIYARYDSSTYLSDGLVYENNEDGYFSISKYTGTDGYVIVPETYKEVPITGVKSRVFGKEVNYIQLPSGIDHVEENAFADSEWYLSYPGDFVVYDDYILVGYKGNAKEVYVPSGITLVADGVFRDNVSMEYVHLPDTITKIVDDMFNGCVNLKSITIGKNVTAIGERAFLGCSSLATINVESDSTLRDIAARAFEGTKWFDAQTDDCIILNSIFYKYCGNATELHISNGITSIAAEAFMDNIRLRTVYFPTTVQSVYQRAFADSAVSEIILPETGSQLGYILDSAFYQCYNLSKFDFAKAKDLTEINDYSFYGCSSLGDIVLPDKLRNIGGYAFANSGVKSVTIRSGSALAVLSKGAFSRCANLYDFSFEGSSVLVTIDEKAFYECVSLSVYSNPTANVTTIEREAFYNCRSLSVFETRAQALTAIGTNAFYNVGDNVFSVESKNNMVILGNILLSYRGSEERVTIPDNIVLIYNRAFYGNTHIQRVTFASQSNLKNLNDEVFRNCTNLISIDFPDSIDFVGDDVMTGTAWYNEKLRNDDFITIGKTLIKYNVKVVRDAEIPAFVTTINKGAFEGTSVYDVKIGENLTLIKAGAFDGIVDAVWTEGRTTCTGFTITMNNTVPPRLEYETILDNCYRIYVSDEDVLDTYRLNTDWNIQFSRISVIKKYTLNYSVKLSEGNIIEPESLHALYNAKPVTTVSNARKQYEFVGWFLDEEYFNAVTYPLILTKEMTIYAKCVDYSIGSNPQSYTLCDVEGKDEYTITEYHDVNDKKVVVITEQAGKKITSISGHLGYIESDYNLFYTVGTDVDGNTYVLIEDDDTGERYYMPASRISSRYMSGQDYYYRKEININAGLVGTTIPDNVFSPGRDGYYLYEITDNSWCSTREVKEFSDGDHVYLNVEYCDCDAFGVIMKTGINANDAEILENLKRHSTGAAVSQNIIDLIDGVKDQNAQYVGSIADLFNTLLLDGTSTPLYTTATESNIFAEVGTERYTNFDSFVTKLKTLFNSSNITAARNLSYETTDGAVIGLNVPYMLVPGSDAPQKDYEGYREVLSHLFGYVDVNSFANAAEKIRSVIRSNVSLDPNDKLMFDGAIVARNGFVIIPYVFAGSIGSIDPVLACVVIDNYDGISVWVNDLNNALNASNIAMSDYGSNIPSIDVYGRCKLFRTGKEKYVEGTRYYNLVKKEECVLYILDPDTEEGDTPEFVEYKRAFHGESDRYVFYRRNTLIEEITFANNCTIEELGENCFAGMTSLKKITLPASLKTIAANAFADCVSLEEIVFTDGISDVVIKKYAFKNCASLIDLTVPTGIKTLESYAFIGCTKLVNIYAEAPKPYDLKEAEPFDFNTDLRILVRLEDYNIYYSAWSKYKDYLVIREDE